MALARLVEPGIAPDQPRPGLGIVGTGIIGSDIHTDPQIDRELAAGKAEILRECTRGSGYGKNGQGQRVFHGRILQGVGGM